MLALNFWCRANGTNDEKKPDDQTDKEKDLPDPAEVDVFVALMSPEKRVRGGEFVVDA
jgi:hypothetical protein